VSKHLVLIGLSGAGKSVVARRVAAKLRTAHEDLDEAIVAAAGRSIPAIFAELGEPAFRDLERGAMRRALNRPPHVIAAGAGWAAQPGNLEAVAAEVVVIHLACSPATAATRVGRGDDRPLLAGDTLAALQRLSAEREPFYARADAVVDTEGRGVDAVARDVVRLARFRGGW
jgi:shikimate kinase